MFGRLRLRLTLWYVGVLAVTLLAVGSLVYWLVARSLDNEINSSLHAVNRLDAQVLSQPPALGTSPNIDGSGDGDEYGAVLSSRLLSGTGDVIPVVLDTEGQVIANPRRVEVEKLPIATAVSAARGSGSNQRDAQVDDHHVRLFTQQVVGTDGRPLGFVMTLKSLEARDADLRRLLVLLAIGGAVGIVLAGAGGLWVAQLAIRPVRRAFDRQRDFVADASHELRTPLTVIRANAESLLGKASPYDREALQDIVDEAGQMGRLVTDLLALAQADRAKLELRREPLDLFDVVEAVQRAGRRLAEERGQELIAHAEHLTVDGDADRLRELLLILLDNALRYSPAGGRVVVEAKRVAQHAEIVVEDTGIGIEPEHLGRIFDRFYRADKARSRAEGGLGLGLSIARAIVEAHGGSISAKSAPGRGTTVRVVLPAMGARAAPEASPLEPQPTRGHPGLS